MPPPTISSYAKVAEAAADAVAHAVARRSEDVEQALIRAAHAGGWAGVVAAICTGIDVVGRLLGVTAEQARNPRVATGPPGRHRLLDITTLGADQAWAARLVFARLAGDHLAVERLLNQRINDSAALAAGAAAVFRLLGATLRNHLAKDQ